MLDSRLSHVVAVARSGSFTGASQIVNITQSAITKSVADLERQIGYSIFYRTSRGVLLTERGRDFIERATRLLEDAQGLLKGSTTGDDIFGGVLRVGVCPASLDWRLIDPLAELLRRHPSIRLDVSGAAFERMVQQVRTGSVDVAVGFEAAFMEWPDLQRESVGSLETVLFVRVGHPLLQRSSITLGDLAPYDFVSPSDSRPYGSTIRNLYESQGIEWQKRLHVVDYFPIARRIVEVTDAIGAVARETVHSSYFRSQFATLDRLDPQPFPPLTLCCAWDARWHPRPAIRAFIRAMSRPVSPEIMSVRNTPTED